MGPNIAKGTRTISVIMLHLIVLKRITLARLKHDHLRILIF